MRTFLVTGGAGFIGSHIADALAARGDRVRVLDSLDTGHRRNVDATNPRIEFTQGDIRDEALVGKLAAGCDAIFHQAALASVPRSVESPLASHDVCATGALVVLDQARRAGVRRVVFAASSAAYGNQPASSKRESDLPMPLSPYAAAKLAAEAYLQAFHHTYGLETVALRYFNVFGPRQDPNSPYSAVIPIWISRMLAGERPVVYGDGQQTRDFTYVTNVVHANLLAADAPQVSGRVFNIANGRSTSLVELIAALNRYLGTKIEPDFRPARIGDVKDSLADITLARQYLGYEPQVWFEEGIEKSIAFYKSGEWQVASGK